MGHVQDNAAARARDRRAKPQASRSRPIPARASKGHPRRRAAAKAIVDFAGTSAQQPDTFNAPEPITRLVLYVLARWSMTTFRQRRLPDTSRLSFRWFDAQPRIPQRSPPAMSR
jgi:N-methylhydantoinase B/oxoprolinase/acetone carboxylase alpha subunit